MYNKTSDPLATHSAAAFTSFSDAAARNAVYNIASHLTAEDFELKQRNAILNSDLTNSILINDIINQNKITKKNVDQNNVHVLVHDLTPKIVSEFKSLFQCFDIQQTEHNRRTSGHPIAAALNRLCRQYAINEILGLPHLDKLLPSKHYDFVLKEIGASPMHIHGMLNVHGCIPLEDSKSIQRWNEYNIKLHQNIENANFTKSKKTYKIKQRAMDAMAYNNISFCHSKSQNCNKKAKYILAAHVYDMTPEDKMVTMIKSNASLMVGYGIFDPNILRNPNGITHCGIRYERKIVHGNDRIFFAFSDGSLGYDHDYHTYVRNFMLDGAIQINYKGNNYTFTYDIHYTASDHYFWKISRNHYTDKQASEFNYRIYKDLNKDMISLHVMTMYQFLSPDFIKMGPYSNMRIVRLTLPKALYNNVMKFTISYASKTQSNFIVQDVRQAVVAFCSEKMSGNLSILESQPYDLTLEEMYALADHLYFKAFMHNNMSSKFTAAMTNEFKDAINASNSNVFVRMLYNLRASLFQSYNPNKVKPNEFVDNDLVSSMDQTLPKEELEDKLAEENKTVLQSLSWLGNKLRKWATIKPHWVTEFVNNGFTDVLTTFSYIPRSTNTMTPNYPGTEFSNLVEEVEMDIKTLNVDEPPFRDTSDMKVGNCDCTLTPVRNKAYGNCYIHSIANALGDTVNDVYTTLKRSKYLTEFKNKDIFKWLNSSVTLMDVEVLMLAALEFDFGICVHYSKECYMYNTGVRQTHHFMLKDQHIEYCTVLLTPDKLSFDANNADTIALKSNETVSLYAKRIDNYWETFKKDYVPLITPDGNIKTWKNYHYEQVTKKMDPYEGMLSNQIARSVFKTKEIFINFFHTKCYTKVFSLGGPGSEADWLLKCGLHVYGTTTHIPYTSSVMQHEHFTFVYGDISNDITVKDNLDTMISSVPKMDLFCGDGAINIKNNNCLNNDNHDLISAECNMIRGMLNHGGDAYIKILSASDAKLVLTCTELAREFAYFNLVKLNTSNPLSHELHLILMDYRPHDNLHPDRDVVVTYFETAFAKYYKLMWRSYLKATQLTQGTTIKIDKTDAKILLDYNYNLPSIDHPSETNLLHDTVIIGTMSQNQCLQSSDQCVSNCAVFITLANESITSEDIDHFLITGDITHYNAFGSGPISFERFDKFCVDTNNAMRCHEVINPTVTMLELIASTITLHDNVMVIYGGACRCVKKIKNHYYFFDPHASKNGCAHVRIFSSIDQLQVVFNLTSVDYNLAYLVKTESKDTNSNSDAIEDNMVTDYYSAPSSPVKVISKPKPQNIVTRVLDTTIALLTEDRPPINLTIAYDKPGYRIDQHVDTNFHYVKDCVSRLTYVPTAPIDEKKNEVPDDAEHNRTVPQDKEHNKYTECIAESRNLHRYIHSISIKELATKYDLHNLINDHNSLFVDSDRIWVLRRDYPKEQFRIIHAPRDQKNITKFRAVFMENGFYYDNDNYSDKVGVAIANNYCEYALDGLFDTALTYILGRSNSTDLPKMNMIMAPPGSGKTYTIVSESYFSFSTSKPFLVTTHTREGKHDIRDKILDRYIGNSKVDMKLIERNLKTHVRTVGSYLINQHDQPLNVETIYFDEAPMNMVGDMLAIVMNELRSVKIIKCFGDLEQIPFINRNEDFKLLHQNIKNVISIDKILDTSYRIPMDVACFISKYYLKYDIERLYTKNKTIKSVTAIMISNVADVPNDPSIQYLTFTKEEKEELFRNKYKRVSTIHEYEGKENNVVSVVRLSNNDAYSVWNSEPHLLVALSRHKQRFCYYSVVRDTLFNICIDISNYDEVTILKHKKFDTSAGHCNYPKTLISASYDYYPHVKEFASFTLCKESVKHQKYPIVYFVPKLGRKRSTPIGKPEYMKYSIHYAKRANCFYVVACDYSRDDFKLSTIISNVKHLKSYCQIMGITKLGLLDTNVGDLSFSLLSSALYSKVFFKNVKFVMHVTKYHDTMTPGLYDVAVKNTMTMIPNKVTTYIMIPDVLCPQFMDDTFTTPNIPYIQSMLDSIYHEKSYRNFYMDDEYYFRYGEYDFSTFDNKRRTIYDVYPFPNYDKLQPLLLTPIPSNFNAKSSRCIHKSAAERNAIVCNMSYIHDTVAAANQLFGTLLSLCNGLDLSISNNIVDVDTWLSKQPPEKTTDLINDPSYVFMNVNRVVMEVKKTIKPIVTPKDAGVKLKGGQVIAHYKETTLNAIYSPIFDKIKNYVVKRLPPWIKLNVDLDVSEFAKLVNIDCKNCYGLFSGDDMIIHNHTGTLELDASKFDKSQGLAVLLFEYMIMVNTSVPEHLALTWLKSHLFGFFRNMNTGLKFRTFCQRRSGDSATWLGNTLYLLTVIGSYIDLLHLPTFDIPHFVNNFRFEIFANKFNLEMKNLTHPKSRYFCSKFIITDSTGNLHIVPDPLKLVLKLGRRDMINHEHVECYRMSFLDSVKSYQNLEVRLLLSDCIADRYNVQINLFHFISMLYSLPSDKEAFHSLYYVDPSRNRIDNRPLNPNMMKNFE